MTRRPAQAAALVAIIFAAGKMNVELSPYWRQFNAHPACSDCLHDGAGHAWRTVPPYVPDPMIPLEGRGRDLYHPPADAPTNFLNPAG